METLLTIVHVLIAIVLIGLVLIQDSKGGALGIGGSSSNSLLGAGGAQTLAAQATRWVAGLFAVTCIGLSIWTANKTSSVVSGITPLPVTQPAATPSTEPAVASGTESTTAPAAAPTTAPTTAPQEKK
jgi:preprotein translocase subunit SecG